MHTLAACLPFNRLFNNRTQDYSQVRTLILGEALTGGQRPGDNGWYCKALAVCVCQR